MTDTTASAWLAVIALSVLTQTLLFVGAAILLYRRLTAAERRLHVLERDSLVPLLAKIELALGDAQETLARVRRADDDARGALGHVTRAASELLRRAHSRAWPVWGMVEGARAAVHALARDDAHRAGAPPAAGAMRNEPRFTAGEGGHVDVRS
jgi:hypothetical protein